MGGLGSGSSEAKWIPTVWATGLRGCIGEDKDGQKAPGLSSVDSSGSALLVLAAVSGELRRKDQPVTLRPVPAHDGHSRAQGTHRISTMCL